MHQAVHVCPGVPQGCVLPGPMRGLALGTGRSARVCVQVCARPASYTPEHESSAMVLVGLARSTVDLMPHWGDGPATGVDPAELSDPYRRPWL